MRTPASAAVLATFLIILVAGPACAAPLPAFAETAAPSPAAADTPPPVKRATAKKPDHKGRPRHKPTKTVAHKPPAKPAASKSPNLGTVIAGIASWAAILGLLVGLLRRLGRMLGLGRRRGTAAPAPIRTIAPHVAAPRRTVPVAAVAPTPTRLSQPDLAQAYREAMDQPHMSATAPPSLPRELPPSVSVLDTDGVEAPPENLAGPVDPAILADLESDEVDADRDREGAPFDGDETWQRDVLASLKTTLAADAKALSWRYLLNRQEFPLFEKVLDQWARGRCLRLMAQVNMGEFIRTRSGLAEADAVYKAFGSKRVDFLVCDWLCRPLIAVEYHGGGHFQGAWEIRDAIKDAALEAVGIPLVVVPEGYAAKTVRAQLNAAFDRVERTPGKVRQVYAMRPDSRAVRGARS